MTGSKSLHADKPSFFARYPTASVAAGTLLPIALIGLLARHFAALLRPVVPIDLTNFAAARFMLANFVHGSTRGDSWVPMDHALALLRGPDWNNLYQTLFFTSHVRFQYAPTSLLSLDFLRALGLFSVPHLNALNSLVFLLNAIAAGWLSWLLFREVRSRQTASGGEATPNPLALGVLAAVTAFLFYPLVRADVLGQIQLWIDLLFTAALVSWTLERRWLAGVLIGLACTLKPQFALLLLWAVLWREWPFLLGALASFVPLAIVSLFRYGLHNHIAYLDVLSFLSRHGENFFANNSVNGILNWYISGENNLHWNESSFTAFHPIVYAGTLAASLIVLAAVVAPPILLRGRRATLTDLAAVAICSVVGSPVAWEHHYGILFPLFFVALWQAFDGGRGTQRGWALAVIFVSWILVANFIPFACLLSGSMFTVFQAHAFFGGILLLCYFLAASVAIRSNAPVARGFRPGGSALGGLRG